MKTKTCIILAVFVVLAIILSWIASANSKPIIHMEYTVSDGDTLWEIAESFTDDSEDVRKVIYDIRRINKLDSAEIYPGDVIIIPCGE